MSVLDEQFKQAIAALKAGRKDEARDLLLDIVDKNERHEQAWLYLSALVDSLEDQETCLENVLELNPANEKARQALEKVRQKRAKRGQTSFPPAPTPTPPEPAAPPFASLDWDAIPEPPLPNAPASDQTPPTPPIGAEFATVSGDSLVGGVPGDNLPPFAGEGAAPDDALDWLSTPPALPTEGTAPAVPDTPTPDPFASPTSVDWARDAGHTTHGSGQQVDLPSSQQYDDWVRNLNLGGGEPSAVEPETLPADTNADNVAPFAPESVAPFGGTEYMVEENAAFAANEPPATETPSPFGVNMFEAESAWGDETASAPPTGESAFTAETGAALDTVADEVFEGGTPFVEDEGPTVGGGDVFTDADVFEAPSPAATADEPDFDFESAPAALRAAARSKGTRSAAAATDYFAQIPADIEPIPTVTRRGVLLLVAIVVMIVLNGVSFVWLF